MKSQNPRKRRSPLAPVSRLLRRKYRPRGKGFQPGNRHGVAHRFAPGQSGNPDGCPRYKELSNALRKFLEMDPHELKVFRPRTAAEAAAKNAILEGVLKKKNLGWFSEVADRTEGRPSVAIHFDERDPLADIVAAMNTISEKIGPPVGEEAEEEEQQ